MIPLIYKVNYGTYINTAVKGALELARKRNRKVRFKFNDLTVTVHKRLSAQHVLRQYDEQVAAGARRYKDSDEYREYRRERAIEARSNQTKVDELIAELPGLTEMDEHIGWLLSFVRSADDVDVLFDHQELAKTLEAKGYHQNRYAGEPPEFYTTRQHVGHYLMGQVLSFLIMGMGPYPIAEKFCEDYFALPADTETPP